MEDWFENIIIDTLSKASFNVVRRVTEYVNTEYSKDIKKAKELCDDDNREDAEFFIRTYVISKFRDYIAMI